LKPAAILPVRGKTNIPWKINVSSDHNTDWQGFIYSNLLRNSFNPERNFVASANNFYSDTLSSYVSYCYDNHSRIHRINDYLFKLKEYEIRDIKNMQLDNYSNYAKEIMKIIVPILKESLKFLTPKERALLRDMQKWDCVMAGNKISPTIFNAFMLNLIYKTFYDELGNELFLDYTYNSSFAYNRILELLSSKSSIFFDNINTLNTENSQYLIYQSFKDAINYVAEYSGSTNPKDWYWSKFHKIKLNHLLESNNHLNNIFSTSEIGISGSWETINYGNWEFRKPFNVRTGTAARFISDMRDSIVYSIIPGGISGDPTNMHFSNQYRIWANGGYFKMLHSTRKINSKNIRTFSPKK
jgi:acyl-homoserine lactone acylase PvdQ